MPKQTRFKRHILTQAILMGLYAGNAVANPYGEDVVSGAADFNRNGNLLEILQHTDKAIIEWQGFSINVNELTRFIQPNSNSAVLNRVITGNPSELLGDLQANGKVFLINPNGIVVGAGANINTQSFIASTLDVSNEDFNNGGDLHFQGDSSASITHLGKIDATGGDVFLIAKHVDNQGEIKADGNVGLAGANDVILKASGDDRLAVRVTDKDGRVDQKGLVEAAKIELRTAGNNPYALAINHEGVTRATSAVNKQGRIILFAEGGTTRADGTLDASALESGDGGFIETSGTHVQIAETIQVDTSATNGETGTWLIDPEEIEINSTSTIAGSSLITASTIETNLTSNNVSITSNNALAGNGNVTVNESITETSTTNNLTLNAGTGGSINVNQSINVGGDINLNGGDGAAGGNAGTAGTTGGNGADGGNVVINAAISSSQGNINVTAGDGGNGGNGAAGVSPGQVGGAGGDAGSGGSVTSTASLTTTIGTVNLNAGQGGNGGQGAAGRSFDPDGLPIEVGTGARGGNGGNGGNGGAIVIASANSGSDILLNSGVGGNGGLAGAGGHGSGSTQITVDSRPGADSGNGGVGARGGDITINGTLVSTNNINAQTGSGGNGGDGNTGGRGGNANNNLNGGFSGSSGAGGDGGNAGDSGDIIVNAAINSGAALTLATGHGGVAGSGVAGTNGGFGWDPLGTRLGRGGNGGQGGNGGNTGSVTVNAQLSSTADLVLQTGNATSGAAGTNGGEGGRNFINQDGGTGGTGGAAGNGGNSGGLILNSAINSSADITLKTGASGVAGSAGAGGLAGLRGSGFRPTYKNGAGGAAGSDGIRNNISGSQVDATASTGSITVDGTLAPDAGNNLKLIAGNLATQTLSIINSQDINLTGTGSINLQGSGFTSTNNFNTEAGNINFNVAGGGLNLSGTITASNADVNLNSIGNLNASGLITGNNINLSATGTNSAIGSSGAGVQTNTGGTLTANANDGNGGIFLSKKGDVVISDLVLNADTGDVELNADGGNLSTGSTAFSFNGTNLTLATTETASNNIAGDRNVIISAGGISASTTNLVIRSADDVISNGSIDVATLQATAGNGNANERGGNINITQAITTRVGNLSLTAGTGGAGDNGANGGNGSDGTLANPNGQNGGGNGVNGGAGGSITIAAILNSKQDLLLTAGHGGRGGNGGTGVAGGAGINNGNGGNGGGDGGNGGAGGNIDINTGAQLIAEQDVRLVAGNGGEGGSGGQGTNGGAGAGSGNGGNGGGNNGNGAQGGDIMVAGTITVQRDIIITAGTGGLAGRGYFPNAQGITGGNGGPTGNGGNGGGDGGSSGDGGDITIQAALMANRDIALFAGSTNPGNTINPAGNGTLGGNGGANGGNGGGTGGNGGNGGSIIIDAALDAGRDITVLAGRGGIGDSGGDGRGSARGGTGGTGSNGTTGGSGGDAGDGGDITLNAALNADRNITVAVGAAGLQRGSGGGISFGPGDTPVIVLGVDGADGQAGTITANQLDLNATSGSISVTGEITSLDATNSVSLLAGTAAGQTLTLSNPIDFNLTGAANLSLQGFGFSSANNFSTVDGDININSGDGALDLTGTVTATNGDVTLTSGGNLTASQILTANNINLNATGSNAAIGSTVQAIQTNASGIITASAANGTGGIFLSNQGNLQLGDINSGTGDATLTAIDGSLSSGINLINIAGTNLTLITTENGSNNTAGDRNIQIGSGGISGAATNLILNSADDVIVDGAINAASVTATTGNGKTGVGTFVEPGSLNGGETGNAGERGGNIIVNETITSSVGDIQLTAGAGGGGATGGDAAADGMDNPTGTGGNSGGTGGAGGAGGNITVNAALTAVQDIRLTAGNGGFGGDGGEGSGNGGAGFSNNNGGNSGGTRGAGGDGGNITINATLDAVRDIQLTAGQGGNGGFTISGSSGRGSGGSSENGIGGNSGGTGGAGGAGGSITVNAALDATRNIQLLAGRGGEGSLGSRGNGLGGIGDSDSDSGKSGGAGGAGGAGGSITINAALNAAQDIQLIAGQGGRGGNGGDGIIGPRGGNGDPGIAGGNGEINGSQIAATATNGTITVTGEINAGTDDVTLTGANLNLSDLITANNILLSATAADAAIGTSGSAIQINTTGSITANASTGNGGIFVSQQGNWNITTDSFNAGTGGIVLTALDGSLTIGTSALNVNAANLTLITTEDASNNTAGDRNIQIGSGGISGGTTNLTLTSADDVVIGGAITAGSLTANSNTEFTGNHQVATTGSQIYNGSVTVNDAMTFSASGATGDIEFHQGLTTTDADTDLVVLAGHDINVDGVIQYDGTGSVNLIAGWDGSTAFNAVTFLNEDVTSTSLFGNNMGSVFIGDGAQIFRTAVGSRNGATNVFANDLNIRGGNAGPEQIAQLGFQASNQGAAYTINGAINVRTVGDITAVAGSPRDTYAQLGHAGGDLEFDPPIEASTSADISIAAGGDINFTGGSGERTYAQLGNGGFFAKGNHSGAIKITKAGTITFNAGSVVDAYAQLGHGGHSADGNHSGAITISDVGAMTFSGGTGGGSASAQLGHGGFFALGNHSGDITITKAGTVSFSGGSGNVSPAQLGHGGRGAVGNHSGDITITEAGTINLTAGSGSNSSARLGHGGRLAKGNQSGDIDITSTGDLTLTGIDTIGKYALIGHGDTAPDFPDANDNGETASGHVTLKVQGSAQLSNAFIGHRLDSDGVYTSGRTWIAVGGNLTADATSRFDSASAATGGELRIYLSGTDGVNAATLLNGTAHGSSVFPNNQGSFNFGEGGYVVPGSDVAGEFNYYNLLSGFNHVVGTDEAAAIVTALGTGDVTLDTSVEPTIFESDFVFSRPEIIVNAAISYNEANNFNLISLGDITINQNITNTGDGAFSANAQQSLIHTGGVALSFTGAGDITLSQQGNFDISNLMLDSGTGQTTITAVDGSLSAGATALNFNGTNLTLITTEDGSNNTAGDRNIQIGSGGISGATTNITFTSADDVIVDGSVNVASVTATAGDGGNASGFIPGSGSLNQRGSGNAGERGGDIIVNQTITSTVGDINLTAGDAGGGARGEDATFPDQGGDGGAGGRGGNIVIAAALNSAQDVLLTTGEGGVGNNGGQGEVIGGIGGGTGGKGGDAGDISLTSTITATNNINLTTARGGESGAGGSGGPSTDGNGGDTGDGGDIQLTGLINSTSSNISLNTSLQGKFGSSGIGSGAQGTQGSKGKITGSDINVRASNGSVSVAGEITPDVNTDVTLLAGTQPGQTLTITGNLASIVGGVEPASDINLTGTGNLTLQGFGFSFDKNISTADGNIDINSGDGALSLTSTLSSTNGDVSLTSGDALTVIGAITASNGNVDLTSVGDLNVLQQITANNINLLASGMNAAIGNVHLMRTDSSNVVNATASNGSGGIFLAKQGDFDISNAINLNAGSGDIGLTALDGQLFTDSTTLNVIADNLTLTTTETGSNNTVGDRNITINSGGINATTTNITFNSTDDVVINGVINAKSVTATTGSGNGINGTFDDPSTTTTAQTGNAGERSGNIIVNQSITTHTGDINFTTERGGAGALGEDTLAPNQGGSGGAGGRSGNIVIAADINSAQDVVLTTGEGGGGGAGGQGGVDGGIGGGTGGAGGKSGDINITGSVTATRDINFTTGRGGGAGDGGGSSVGTNGTGGDTGDSGDLLLSGLINSTAGTITLDTGQAGASGSGVGSGAPGTQGSVGKISGSDINVRADAGDINVNAEVAADTNGNVTLIANTLNFAALQDFNLSGSGNLTLQSNGFNSANNFTTQDGDISINSGNAGITLSGTVDSGNGDLSVTAGGFFNITNTLQGNDISLAHTGNPSMSGIQKSAGGAVDIQATGKLNVDTTNGSAAIINQTGDLQVGTLTGGNAFGLSGGTSSIKLTVQDGDLSLDNTSSITNYNQIEFTVNNGSIDTGTASINVASRETRTGPGTTEIRAGELRFTTTEDAMNNTAGDRNITIGSGGISNGFVTLTSADDVVVNGSINTDSFKVTAGNGAHAVGVGGNGERGGNITINSSVQTNAGAISLTAGHGGDASNTNVNGGIAGQGGDGGSVTVNGSLTGDQDLSQSSFGAVTVIAGDGGQAGSVMATNGTAGNGGHGGDINISGDVTSNIDISLVSGDGDTGGAGSDVAGLGGLGGNGGNIDVQGKLAAQQDIKATSGFGGNGGVGTINASTDGTGGVGGNAGNITLRDTVTAQRHVTLETNSGGEGGEGRDSGGIGMGSSVGTGGNGGNGGVMDLRAAVSAERDLQLKVSNAGEGGSGNVDGTDGTKGQIIGSVINASANTGSLTLDGIINAKSGVDVQLVAGTDLTLNTGSEINATGAGNIILAAGGNFHNDTGEFDQLGNPLTSDPISVDSGRFLIYSTRPDNNNNDIGTDDNAITNNFVGDFFVQYNTAFDINDPLPASLPAGNGFVYSVQPVLTGVAVTVNPQTIDYGQAISSVSGTNFTVGAGSGTTYTVDGTTLTATQIGQFDLTDPSMVNIDASNVELNLASTVGISNAGFAVAGFHMNGIEAGVKAGSTLGSQGIALSGSGNLTVNKRDLNVTLAADNKVYDATTDASISIDSIAAGDLLSGDLVSIDAGTSNFDNKDVGTRTVTLVGESLSGADAGNYILNITGSTLTADITKADLIVNNAVAHNKVYDATTDATITGASVTALLTDTVNLNLDSADFDNKNVGSDKTVTANYSISGTDAANYNLIQPTTLSADITQRTLNASLTADNKVYDATTAATGVFGDDRVGSDMLTITGTSTFDNKNVGTNKTVTASGLSLSGTDALNYVLASTTVNGTADITKADLTVSGAVAQNKVYDTTTTATVTGGSITGLGSDLVTLVAGAANFIDKNADTGKTVNTNFTLSGIDAANYNVVQPTTLTADITKANVSIDNAVADNKVYDATITATISGASVTGLGMDDISIAAANASFDNKNVGTAKAVTTNFTLGGADAGNYNVIQPTGLMADVTPADLIVNGAVAQNKVYDASRDAIINGASVTALGSDVVTLGAANANFDTKDVGTGKAVTTNFTLGGADAGNYNVIQQTGLMADVTPAMLDITANNDSKAFDGIAYSGGNGVSYSGFVGGETDTVLGGSLIFAGSSQGATNPGNYVITPGGLTSNNYDINFIDGVLTVTTAPSSGSSSNSASQNFANFQSQNNNGGDPAFNNSNSGTSKFGKSQNNLREKEQNNTPNMMSWMSSLDQDDDD